MAVSEGLHLPVVAAAPAGLVATLDLQPAIVQIARISDDPADPLPDHCLTEIVANSLTAAAQNRR